MSVVTIVDKIFETKIAIVHVGVYLFDRFEQLSRVDVVGQFGEKFDDVNEVGLEKRVFVEVENAQGGAEEKLFLVAKEHVPYATHHVQR